MKAKTKSKKSAAQLRAEFKRGRWRHNGKDHWLCRFPDGMNGGITEDRAEILLSASEMEIMLNRGDTFTLLEPPAFKPPRGYDLYGLYLPCTDNFNAIYIPYIDNFSVVYLPRRLSKRREIIALEGKAVAELEANA